MIGTLYGSGASPFVRAVRIVMAELGVMDRVRFERAEGVPTDPPGARDKVPLRKIPFLETPGGALYYDSRVVIEALAEAAAPERRAAVAPAEPGPARLDALRRQALGFGICDVAVSLAYERRLRPEALHWPEWHALQWGKVASGVAAAEAEAPPAGRFDIGDIALYSALAYLDLRYDEKAWRTGNPRLTAFFEAARQRPSVQAAES